MLKKPIFSAWWRCKKTAFLVISKEYLTISADNWRYDHCNTVPLPQLQPLLHFCIMKLLSETDFSFYFNYFIGRSIQLKLIKYNKIKQFVCYENKMFWHTSSKILVYSDKATGALKIPAHPQELSFLCRSWGALSVPRKYCLLPLVTAERIVCPVNTIKTYDQSMQRLHNRTESHLKHPEKVSMSWYIIDPNDSHT